MSGVPANLVFESRGADLYALEGRIDLSTVPHLMAVGTSALAGSTNPTISLAGASAEEGVGGATAKGGAEAGLFLG